MTLLALLNAGAIGTPVLGDLLRAWTLPLVPFIGLSLTLILYLRGWRVAKRTRPAELPPWRVACFICGVIALWLALASPIDALDDSLLMAHMIQHFILMSIAPPLIAAGAPVVPILRGMPRMIILGLGVFFRTRWIRKTLRAVMHPVLAWLAMNLAYLGWHVPVMFELTFRSQWIHDCEHFCFFATSLAFWWVVLEPWPSVGRWPRWAIIPYLLSADILNTILSATLAFAGRVIYPSYKAAPRICLLTPLQDQVAAGAEMWILNSLVFLLPAVMIAIRQLSPRFSAHAMKETQPINLI